MKIKLLLTTLLLSGLAQANDSTIYEMPVQGIDPVESKVNSELVKFYGKEASDFMKLLPPVMTVPPYRDEVAKHSKMLQLSSKAYTLSFSCSDADVESDPSKPDSENAIIVREREGGAGCTISLSDANTEGDTANFAENGGKEKVIKQLGGKVK